MAALAGRDTTPCPDTSKLTAAQWTHEGAKGRDVTFDPSCSPIRGS